METSLTTSAVSRDTISVQAAGAGSHELELAEAAVDQTPSVVECPSSTLEDLASHQ